VENQSPGQIVSAEVEVDGQPLGAWTRPLPHAPRPDGWFGDQYATMPYERTGLSTIAIGAERVHLDVTVVLRRWIVWCGYCRAQRPMLFKVQTRFACEVERAADAAGAAKIVLYEGGGITTPVVERPRLRVE
jgi:hypothetical protein